MATTQTRIVTVWLDETSDDHGWIVDTDRREGGASETVKVFPPTAAGEKKARAFASEYATRRGLEVGETTGAAGESW